MITLNSSRSKSSTGLHGLHSSSPLDSPACFFAIINNSSKGAKKALATQPSNFHLVLGQLMMNDDDWRHRSSQYLPHYTYALHPITLP